jgi:tetratricopeptide (TPR) repeat protein
LATWSIACATPQTRADRAYEQQEYRRALDEYRETIRRGTDSWKTYYRAARAATHVGDFGLAEKYYNRAVRHGGGQEVVRAFAEFYVQTSNYSRAVQLYRYLLEYGEGDRQDLYNNLGTALMYAGASIQAESYLLLAQQQAPEDPVPYVNLGLLYERHFQKPLAAIGFYRCYLQLAEGKQQVQRIEARISELIGRYGRPGNSENRMTCGQPYRMAAESETSEIEALEQRRPSEGDDSSWDIGPPPKRTRNIELSFKNSGEKESAPRPPRTEPAFDDEGSGKSDATDDSDSSGETSSDDGAPDGTDESDETTSKPGASSSRRSSEARSSSNGSEKSERQRRETKESEVPPPEPVIESVGDAKPSAAESNVSDGSSEATDEETSRSERSSSSSSALERARMAWTRDQYERVVREISGLSLQSLDPNSMRIYGLSLAELGRNEEAAQWLEWTIERKPDPTAVERLLEVYRRLDRKEDVRTLCQRFQSSSELSTALETCPDDRSSDDNREDMREEYEDWKKRREGGEVIRR